MAPTTASLAHKAFLYRSTDELIEVVGDFVAEARDSGEPVLAALSPASVGLIGEALPDLQDGVRVVEMAELGHNPNCVLGAYEDWIGEHAGPVRLVGEMVWPGRTSAETIECLRHEALLNHALSRVPASILCLFDAQRLPPDVLEGAELTHPRVLADGCHRDSQVYGDPLEVHAAGRWPQDGAKGPVSKHVFQGDLSGLRQAVAEDPIVGTLDRARAADLVFAVNEAVTNAVRHADGSCVTRLWRDGREVISEVHTDSVIEDPVAGCRRPPPGDPDGRGLWLINQLCDLVELRTSHAGTTVRMHVEASGAPAFDAVAAG